MKQKVFTGSGVAIVTPFDQNNEINYDKLRSLIDFQIENGTKSIIACGTTGESATLTHEEHIGVIKATIEHVAKRVPVVASTGSNDTSYALDLSLEAQQLGADGLLMVTPYYNKTSQRGLVAHYNYIADRVKTPIILYNVPGRTGCNIKPQTYAELARHENIVATKEANGDISSIAETIRLCGDKLDVFSGCDDQIVPIMALGAVGVISAFANIAPKQCSDLCEYMLQNDIVNARKLQNEYLDIMNTIFIDVNPIPVKQALNIMGYAVGGLRLPLIEMSNEQISILKKSLQNANLI